MVLRHPASTLVQAVIISFLGYWHSRLIGLCVWFCTIQPIPPAAAQSPFYTDDWLVWLERSSPWRLSMDSYCLLEKPKLLGMADLPWPSSCQLFNPPALSQSILPSPIFNTLYEIHQPQGTPRPEVWAIWHAVSCLHHFGPFCFPAWNGLLPLFHISSQHTWPIISCCRWCPSQSPKWITDSMVEPLCLVHTPCLSQWSFLSIVCPSEFSIPVSFLWWWIYHTSPILQHKINSEIDKGQSLKTCGLNKQRKRDRLSSWLCHLLARWCGYVISPF